MLGGVACESMAAAVVDVNARVRVRARAQGSLKKDIDRSEGRFL